MQVRTIISVAFQIIYAVFGLILRLFLFFVIFFSVVLIIIFAILFNATTINHLLRALLSIIGLLFIQFEKLICLLVDLIGHHVRVLFLLFFVLLAEFLPVICLQRTQNFLRQNVSRSWSKLELAQLANILY